MTAKSENRVEPGSAGGTENALLDAAETCFEEWGVAKTSMEDVARRAGLSRPTLYRYFSDRDALSVAVVMRRSRRLVARTQEVVAAQRGLEDQLVEGLLFLVDQGRRDEIVLELLVDGRFPGVAERLTHSRATARTTGEVWGPVLAAAQQRDELRRDLDSEEAFSWLVQLQVVLVATGGPLDAASERADLRRMLRAFVVPGFRADGARG